MCAQVKAEPEVHPLELGGLEDRHVLRAARRADVQSPHAGQQHLHTQQLHRTQGQICQTVQEEGGLFYWVVWGLCCGVVWLDCCKVKLGS